MGDDGVTSQQQYPWKALWLWCRNIFYKKPSDVGTGFRKILLSYFYFPSHGYVMTADNPHVQESLLPPLLGIPGWHSFISSCCIYLIHVKYLQQHDHSIRRTFTRHTSKHTEALSLISVETCLVFLSKLPGYYIPITITSFTVRENFFLTFLALWCEQRGYRGLLRVKWRLYWYLSAFCYGGYKNTSPVSWSGHFQAISK